MFQDLKNPKTGMYYLVHKDDWENTAVDVARGIRWYSNTFYKLATEVSVIKHTVVACTREEVLKNWPEAQRRKYEADEREYYEKKKHKAIS